MSELMFNFCLNQIIENCSGNYREKIKRRKRRIYRNLVLLKLRHFHDLETESKIQSCGKVIRTYSSDVFHSYFRMKRSTFKKLLAYIDPLWKKSWTGRPPIHAEISLYLTIWRLANKCAMRELSERFCLSIGSVHKMITKMTRVLTSLKENFIRWPQSEEEYLKLMKSFQNHEADQHFPNVIGCLGCTHLRICQPKLDASRYLNRNGTYSIILQLKHISCK